MDTHIEDPERVHRSHLHDVLPNSNLESFLNSSAKEPVNHGAPQPVDNSAEQLVHDGTLQHKRQAGQEMDTTGQRAPKAREPQVRAELWEEEGCICFLVEANGTIVARRDDNDFINATKLLYLAGLTRAKRDAILKPEKTQHVIKNGPTHFRGVWVPFDRALGYANIKRITEILYPLFVHNIGALLYQTDSSIESSRGVLPEASTVPTGAMILPTPPRSAEVSDISNDLPSLSQFYGSPVTAVDTPHTPPSMEGWPSSFQRNVKWEEDHVFSERQSEASPMLKLEETVASHSKSALSAILHVSAATNPPPIDYSHSCFPILGGPGSYQFSVPPSTTPSSAAPTSTADFTNNKGTPASSNSSTFDASEDGQDSAISMIISITSRMILNTYATSLMQEQSGTEGTNLSHLTGGNPQCQTSKHSTAKNRKRKSKPDDESDKEDDQEGRKRQRYDPKSLNHADDQPLACPFNKFDNVLFGPNSPDEAYHACATCSFMNIAHLKQHLRRNHFFPRFVCFRCCRRDFSSQNMVASHLREEPICEKLDPPLYRERIGSDLVEELGLDRKNPTGTNRVEYWHKVFDTFFPGAASARLVSPYYEGPAAEHLHRFLNFSAQAIESVLPVVVERLDLQPTLLQSDLPRLHQDILQEAGQLFLQQTSSRLMPHLGHAPLLSGDAPVEVSANRPTVSDRSASISRQTPSTESNTQLESQINMIQAVHDGEQSSSSRLRTERSELDLPSGTQDNEDSQASHSIHDRLLTEIEYDPFLLDYDWDTAFDAAMVHGYGPDPAIGNVVGGPIAAE